MSHRLNSASLLACGAFVAVAINAGYANGSAPITQKTDTCAVVTADEIAALFDRWNATVATAHPDKMTRLYAPDATLLPANGTAPRTGYAAIRDYFVYALQGQPRAEVVSRAIRAGCDMATDTGVQTVSTGVKGTPGAVETEKQRYTLVYRRFGGNWLIEHHHASKLADGDDAARAAKPIRLPVVAGYVRRANETPRPQSLRPAGASIPVATGGYKSGTWSDGVPDFGSR